MTSESEPGGPGAPRDEADLGEPVADLRDLTATLDDGFPGRVRRRVERRVLASEALELLWTAPIAMLLEFVRWPFDFFTDRRK